MQRWQVTFSRGEQLRFVGHLDLMRAWERVLRRASIALAFSEGFRPHPKMAFAAPLPVGLTAKAELLDLTLRCDTTEDALAERIAPQLPDGLRLLSAELLEGPALPSRLRSAIYRAGVADVSRVELERQCADLLAADELPRGRQKERQVKHYDLRPLIIDLRVEDAEELIVVMHLKADHNGAGRPDEVLSALGITSSSHWIERSRLMLAPSDGSGQATG